VGAGEVLQSNGAECDSVSEPILTWLIHAKILSLAYSRLHIVLHNEMHDAATDVTDSRIPTCQSLPCPEIRLRARPYPV
jgi:hypothetical protein